MSADQSEICKFFKSRNGCKNGTHCRFLHPDEHSPQHDEEASITSKQHAQPLKDEKDHSLVRDVKAQPKCKFFFSGRACYAGENCHYSHSKNENDGLNGDDKKGKAATKVSTGHAETEKIANSENQEDSVDVKENSEKVKICQYYARNKRCMFGTRCRFAHIYNSNEKKPEVNENDTKGTLKEQKKGPICRYFKEGNCHAGKSCRFLHSQQGVNEEKKLLNPRVEISKYPPVNPQQSLDRVLLTRVTDEELKAMRSSEIHLLKKRFPKFIETESAFQVKFSSSDPDWPYDVKGLTMDVSFPSDYPVKPFDVAIVEDDAAPDQVQEVVMEAAQAWVDTRHDALLNENKVELMFRPMLKWLDKKLEELFTDGLRKFQKQLMFEQAQAAGIQFIPGSNQTDSAPPAARPLETLQMETVTREYKKDDVDDDVSMPTPQPFDDISNTPTDTAQVGDISASKRSAIDPVRKGTEITLKNLQMKENAATLLANKIMVVIQCDRCKSRCDIQTPGHRLNSIPCTKCHNDQLLTFRPALLHQFSSIVGYLDVQGCLAFDLILQDCQFTAGCLGCSSESKLKGVSPGQPNTSWCQQCHGRILIATESATFKQLQPSDGFDKGAAHIINVTKPVKAVKDPSVKDGLCLPENGICKHYKKSYRWFRFPCCGKCYPCDVCHEEQEGDHEMKLANRMLCGFCSREQPFASEANCVSCGKSMTHRSTAFWEGGKGCRDKVKMSRTEDRKYAGVHKTVSKKAQAKQDTSKKTTKVRHA